MPEKQSRRPAKTQDPKFHASISPEEHARRGNPVNIPMPPKMGSDRPKWSWRKNRWWRALDGALVLFGDGARVSKLNLPSDFSAVRLNKLPQGSTPMSISDEMGKLGFSVPTDGVRVVAGQDASRLSADVRVEDPSFAKRLCSKLQSEPAGSNFSREVEAVPINNPLPTSSSSSRVDCKKVHLSWHRPVRLAWLNFGSENIARKVQEKYSRGFYKVLDKTVECKHPTRSGGRHNAVAWTLVLSSVPGNAKKDDVVKGIPAAIRPRHVEMGAPTYNDDIGYMNAIAKSLLTNIGLLDAWEDASDLGGKRAKARARYHDDQDAQDAVATLKNAVMSRNKVVKLTIQHVYSVRMKESEPIYQAVKDDIDKERLVWKSQHVLFIPYPPAKGYRVLKLEGEDGKNVAQAKKSLDGILKGEVVEDIEGKPCWVPAFGTHGPIFQRIKEVRQTLEIAIVRDQRKRQLRLYGPNDKRERATEILRRLAEEAASTPHVIDLGPTQFAWACRGGFRTVSAALPSASVAFDIISTPKRIQITGSDEDYRIALDMVREQLDNSQAQKPSETDAPSCSICWTEADNPILTSCGHDYCGDCFESLCTSGSANPSTSITCQGEMGSCAAIFSLSELQEHLSSSVFENLLHASFTSYVRAHQEAYRYCPSPGCEQIYRCAAAASSASSPKDHLFVCPSCFASICTRCNISHTGITCAEHKDMASGGYEALAEAKARLGIKDCPKCTTPIEKTEGCDHMTCGGCHTHICWRCLKTFETSNQCYTHMNQAHGNIGLEHYGRRLY
ncbi:hypothetical protein MKZ38_008471 [Zalerion maritima]|uniref:RING-type domain-containing protein n=1 Tax=Zalerion maritima TaxID=339359 RepID=A0AAD5WW47_9PEZI|nr:hypothetical protein MKZ38_008471 [Zalerion maritima]